MRDLSLQHWPNEQLETVSGCPVCNSKVNKVLESDLIDRMTNPPTGLWELRNCGDCGIAYLSPRPRREFIYTAYSHYHTHTSVKDDLVHSRLRKLKALLADKYYSVASKTGGFSDYVIYLLVRLFFPISFYLDAKARHIFDVKGKPGRLLDVGCGNGEFLRFANKYGWDTVGVDFDEDAVAEARSDGFDVRFGSVDTIGNQEKFNFISLSHVVEHVYNPVELIQTCYSLLNDGGTLWLETPNIESAGYVLYKANWRGLEPPRHIMLFNHTILREILLKAGFCRIEQRLHGLSGIYMGLASERLLNESMPRIYFLGSSIRKFAKPFRIVVMEVSQMLCKRRREFITFVVRK